MIIIKMEYVQYILNAMIMKLFKIIQFTIHNANKKSERKLDSQRFIITLSYTNFDSNHVPILHKKYTILCLYK